MNYSHTPTPSQLLQTLQTKAVQHTQQPEHNNDTSSGDHKLKHGRWLEQVPTNELDREEYERNKYEFKSWKGTIRYPAPPQQLWTSTQQALTELYQTFNVPQMQDFDHKYLAALFAAMDKPISEQVERVQFFVSDQQAIWLLKLKQDNPPIMSAVWRFSYQFYHATETGSLWNILKEKVIRPSLADEGSVGFYCRASNRHGRMVDSPLHKTGHRQRQMVDTSHSWRG